MHTKYKYYFITGLIIYLITLNYFVLIQPPVFFKISENVHPIKSVQRIASLAQNQSDLPAQGWESTVLPDIWYESHQNKAREYWYRSVIDISNISSDVWAVYIPSVTHNTAVYINGVWIGQGGDFSDPVSRHQNEPLYYEFSKDLLKPVNNEILLHVKAEYYAQGLLGQVYVNSAAELEKEYQFKYGLRYSLIEALTIVLFFLGFVIFVFWLARPQDIVYLIFFLEIMFWGVHNLNLFIAEIPVSSVVWEALIMSTFGWMVASMIYFNHRFVGGGSVLVEKSVMIVSVVGCVVFFLPDIELIHIFGYKIWDVILVMFGCYAIYHLLSIYWASPENDLYLMLLVGLPMLVFGLHDILLINHLGNPLDGLIIQYIVIPAAILFAWFLLKRFVQSVNKAEDLSRSLEAKVELKETELKNQYQRLLKLEQEQVLATERERIMRDMHDGIGGQLVSVIATLQEHSGEIFKKTREKVQNSLTDLRFVIDSLDPALQDMTTVLGAIRGRLDDQLKAAHIQLHWNVIELPEVESMSPGFSLHVMRIIQEAVTNVIKHSEATELSFTTNIDDAGRIVVQICDNGSGNLKANSAGRGLRNMEYRAGEINADLSMESDDKGTCLTLQLNQD